MDDSIYRQETIKAVHEEFDNLYLMEEDGAALADMVEDVLNRQPSAESKIVRCKDCKYYNTIGICNETSWAVCEDSFCCWAERRADE